MEEERKLREQKEAVDKYLKRKEEQERLQKQHEEEQAELERRLAEN